MKHPYNPNSTQKNSWRFDGDKGILVLGDAYIELSEESSESIKKQLEKES